MTVKWSLNRREDIVETSGNCVDVATVALMAKMASLTEVTKSDNWR